MASQVASIDAIHPYNNHQHYTYGSSPDEEIIHCYYRQYAGIVNNIATCLE